MVFFNHDSQLSDEFIERHREIVPWKYISMNYTFSLDFLSRNRKYIYSNLYNQSHPELYDEVERKAWDEISSIYPFTIGEVDLYKDKINWINYLKGDAFRLKENEEKRLIIEIFYDNYIEKVIPYLTKESIVECYVGSEGRWNDMDEVIVEVRDEIKTKIAEKTLKDETIKELEKFKDNLNGNRASFYIKYI